MKLISLFLLIIQFAYAQTHILEITGIGDEEWAKSEAKLLTLKKILNLKGVNAEEFLSQMENRFNQRFQNYKERKLKSNYGANYQVDLNDEQKQSLDENFEREKEGLHRKFTAIDGLFEAKVKQKLLSSPKEDKWEIEVTEIPEAVDQWQKRVAKSSHKAVFLLIPHMSLSGLEWMDLKLKNEESFLSGLWPAWKKWSKESENNLELNFCDERCEDQWLSEKASDSEEINSYFGQEDEVHIVADLRLELRKIKVLPNSEVEYEISGTYSLHDYASGALLEAMNLGPEIKRVTSTEDHQVINSQLANYFYRMAASGFVRLKSFQDFRPYNQVQQLVIEGHKNFLEVLAVENEIRLQLGTFSPRLELFALTKSTIEFKVLYRGEEKNFKELITGLKQLKSSYRPQYVWDTSTKELRLKLVHE